MAAESNTSYTEDRVIQDSFE